MASMDATVNTAFDRQLLSTLLAFRKGDWSVRLPPDLTGISGKIADVLNDIIDANERVAKEFDRVSRVVGREGKLSQTIWCDPPPRWRASSVPWPRAISRSPWRWMWTGARWKGSSCARRRPRTPWSSS
jgi:hypothetical protein